MSEQAPVIDSPAADTTPKGTSAMMDDLMGTPAAPEPQTPEPTPEKVEGDKPAAATSQPKKETTTAPAKPATTKPATTKPEVETEPKDIPSLRKAYQAEKQRYKELETLHNNTKKELETKLAALNSKRAWTPEDEKKFSDLQTELQERNARLYSMDFRQSPEFKQNFEEKWKGQYKGALNRTTGLTVRVPAREEGMEPTERQATKEDFSEVYAAPESKRFIVAKQLFGDNAYLVLQDVNQLHQIERDGEAAVEAKQKTWQTELQQRHQSEEQAHKTYVESMQSGEQELAGKYPTLFGPSENADEQKAYDKGLNFVNSFNDGKSLANMTPQERGFRAALLRSWAASFPREHYRAEVLSNRVKELEAKLASIENTDPGNGGELAPGGESDGGKKPMTTDSMAAELDGAGL